MRVRDFLLFLLFLFSFLAFINIVSPIIDVYTPAYSGDRPVLRGLPAADVAAAKLRHAYRHPTFHIGVFGNSRVLMLSAESLKTSPRSFFNFGVGGQSFRQSVRMLQMLAMVDRMPQIAVISFDHPELGLPGGDPVSPGFFGRTSERIYDLWHLQQTDASAKNLAIFAWNNLVAELRRTQLNFTYSIVFARARLLGAAFISMAPLPNYFGTEGNRIEKLPHTTKAINWPIEFQRAERYLLLERDLDSLAQLATNGRRIIIYESPIAPAVHDHVEANLSANARDVRKRLFAGCVRRKLECFASPVLDGANRGLFWPDATHVPSSLLGDWIRGVIDVEKLVPPSVRDKNSNDL